MTFTQAERLTDAEVIAAMEAIIALITATRRMRARNHIHEDKIVPAYVRVPEGSPLRWLLS